MLVKIQLSENPKAVVREPFVARLLYDAEDPNRCLEFLKPIGRKCGRNGIPIVAEYDVQPGVPYIIRSDWSSHRNARYTYKLVVFDTDGQEKVIAKITVVNHSMVISPTELKMCYAKYRKPIAALWAFWRVMLGLEVNEQCSSDATITQKLSQETEN